MAADQELFEQTLITSLDDTHRFSIGKGLNTAFNNIKWSALKALILSINVWELGSGTKSAQMEGSSCVASGDYSHAEGRNTTASNVETHAEGFSTEATGIRSHAEGNECVASGDYSHAQNYFGTASGDNSHAGGANCEARAINSFCHGATNIVDIAATNGAVLGGTGITATRANVTVLPELEIATVGGGTYIKSPDGTEYKITVANGGTLVITAV